MDTHILVVGALGALVSAAACGGSTGGGGGGSSGATTSDPVDETTFADQFCTLLEPCCADAGLSTNGQSCRVWIALAASQGSYNASAAGACLAAGRAASGQPGFCTNAVDPPSCSQVFRKTGTVAAGGACAKDSECAPSADGNKVQCFVQTQFVDGGTSQTGACEVQIQTGAAGTSPCVGTFSGGMGVTVTQYDWSGEPPPATAYLCDANSGVHCDGKTHACTAAAPVGASCSTTTDCVSSAYCNFGGGPAQCVPRVALGAACTGSASCVADAYCDTTGHCASQLASGAACGTNKQCQSGSCINGACAQGNSGANLGLQLFCGR
jgi:hypothetical protein